MGIDLLGWGISDRTICHTPTPPSFIGCTHLLSRRLARGPAGAGWSLRFCHVDCLRNTRGLEAQQ